MTTITTFFIGVAMGALLGFCICMFVIVIPMMNKNDEKGKT